MLPETLRVQFGENEMKTKFIGLPVAASLVISILGAASASAATEFGDTCAGNAIAPGDYTLTTLSAPGGPLPLTAPSAGVITQVKVRLEPGLPFAIPTTVKALHSAGGNSFTVVGQATVQASGGLSTAAAKIPVQAGDRLALHGQPFTFEGSPVPSLSFYCESTDGSVLGAALGEPGPGVTAEFAPATEGRVPLAALLEPDVDNDGFGDETQDQCPQSAASQGDCPVVTVDAASAIKRKGSIVVLLTASSTAPVQVKGTVNLGKGKKAKLGSKVQTVAPGKVSRFTLKFPKKLKKRLEELTRKQSLQLRVTASATDLIGRVTTDKLKVRLKGQGEQK
jgi:hypothetical protein